MNSIDDIYQLKIQLKIGSIMLTVGQLKYVCVHVCMCVCACVCVCLFVCVHLYLSALCPITSLVENSDTAGSSKDRFFRPTEARMPSRFPIDLALFIARSAFRRPRERRIGTSLMKSTPPAITTSACPVAIWLTAGGQRRGRVGGRERSRGRDRGREELGGRGEEVRRVAKESKKE